MTNQPEYKSLKVTFETWQRLTQLSSITGEPRTKLIERLVNEALKKRDPSNIAHNIAHSDDLRENPEK